MPGFPLAAIGAGLGLFAKQYQEQQAAKERNMMLQMQLQRFQQEMRDRQEERQGESAMWSAMSGMGSGVQPTPGSTSAVTPVSGGFPGGGSMPAGGGGADGGAHWTPAGLKALQPTEGRYDQVHYPSGVTSSGVKSSATGGYGFLDGTWREFAPKAGVDLSQYPRAYMAPPEVQDKVAAITPISHWTGAKDGVPWNPRAQQLARNPAYITGGAGGGGGPQQMASAGPRTATDAQPSSDEIYAAHQRGEPTPGEDGGATAEPRGQQMAQAGPQTATDTSPPDLGSLPPAEEKRVSQGANKLMNNTPSNQHGRKTVAEIMAAVEKSSPGLPAHVKWRMVEKAQKLLEPDQRAELQQFLRDQQHEFQLALKDMSIEAAKGNQASKGYTLREMPDGSAIWIKPGEKSIPVDAPAGTTKPSVPLKQGYQILTDDQHKDAQGNPAPIQYQMVPGKPETAMTMTGEKYVPGGAQRISTQSSRLPTGQAISMQKFIGETRAKEGRDPSSDEIQHFIANQAGLNTAQRVLMNRGTSLELATNVTEETIPLLKETSHKIDRTQFPTLNAVLLAAERGTGGEDVVRFTEQLTALQYVYARALNPTGVPRVEDMRRLDGMISAAWSQGQIDAVLDQITKELSAEKRAVDRTKESASGKVMPGRATGPAQAAPAQTQEGQTGSTPDGKKWIFRGGKWDQVQ